MTLKELRKMRKLTQKTLAEKTGVSQCYICALEKGRKRNPSLDVVQKLAESLEVEVFHVLDALKDAG